MPRKSSHATGPVFHVGCSGWYYRHWKGVVYPADLPTTRWFRFYQEHFNTVELNAPFYRWPRPSTIQTWRRQAQAGLRYTVKVNRLITHLHRFKNSAELIGDFYQRVEPLGPLLGCLLFQLPPSFHFTPERLQLICAQLDPAYRNVVEFRHPSWWRGEVFAAFEKARIIFCSVSGPRLPDDLVKSQNRAYLRLHGAAQWYRYDYSAAELESWAGRLRRAAAREAWVYFNNDFQGAAFRNAATLASLLQEPSAAFGR